MTEELDDMVPAPADEQPILAFLCNPLGKKKAKKIIAGLASAVEDLTARKEIVGLPIKANNQVPKNILVAATTDDATVFTINMKTGEAHYD